jgi:Ca2+-binding RTX toxin-like protein
LEKNVTVFTGDINNNTLTGDGADDFINGKGGNDTLTGNGGADYIIGGTGSDSMYGGLGDDAFQIGAFELAAGEVIDGGTGIDTLLFTTSSPSVSSILADFRSATITSIEKLTFSGGGVHTATFGSNQIGSGLSSALQVNGGTGTNNLNVVMNAAGALNLGGWTFTNWDGADKITVTGTTGNDFITGSSQSETISLGTGTDSVYAGGGDDTIVVGTMASNEIIDGGAGIDTLRVSQGTTDFTLSSLNSIQKLYFGGTGTGTTHNVIVDVDQFSANGLSFLLNIDGTLNDHHSLTVMMGVQSSINLSQVSLANAALDFKMQFVGTAAHNDIGGTQLVDNISGNGGDDELLGYGGNDIINGGAGNDTMKGGHGADTYFVDSASDVVMEVQLIADDGAIDLVHATGVDFTLGDLVENLWLHGGDLKGTGNALANHITGTDGANLLRGLAGNDTIVAGRGIDTLYGNAGADKFVFTSILDSQPIAGARDRVMDFLSGVDKIDVSGIDANAAQAGDQAFVLDTDGTLSAGEFSIATYASGTTILSFNTGVGSVAEMQIQLNNATATIADIIL